MGTCGILVWGSSPVLTAQAAKKMASYCFKMTKDSAGRAAGNLVGIAWKWESCKRSETQNLSINSAQILGCPVNFASNGRGEKSGNSAKWGSIRAKHGRWENWAEMSAATYLKENILHFEARQVNCLLKYKTNNPQKNITQSYQSILSKISSVQPKINRYAKKPEI